MLPEKFEREETYWLKNRSTMHPNLEWVNSSGVGSGSDYTPTWDATTGRFELYAGAPTTSAFLKLPDCHFRGDDVSFVSLELMGWKTGGVNGRVIIGLNDLATQNSYGSRALFLDYSSLDHEVHITGLDGSEDVIGFPKWTRYSSNVDRPLTIGLFLHHISGDKWRQGLYVYGETIIQHQITDIKMDGDINPYFQTQSRVTDKDLISGVRFRQIDRY